MSTANDSVPSETIVAELSGSSSFGIDSARDISTSVPTSSAADDELFFFLEPLLNSARRLDEERSRARAAGLGCSWMDSWESCVDAKVVSSDRDETDAFPCTILWLSFN